MSDPILMPPQTGSKLLEKLAARGIEVQACFQCGRCSAGCPVHEFFDLPIMAVVRLAAYGQERALLESRTIWLCAACETCGSRCPNSIDIAGLVDVLRELALRKGISPAEPRVPTFHESFLGSIRNHGRAYEVGLIMAYKLRARDFAGDLKLGLSMLSKGKLRLRPHSVKAKAEIGEIFSGKGKEYER